MSFRCSYCGTECIEEDGKKFCPNHGIVAEEVEDKDKEDRRSEYIG